VSGPALTVDVVALAGDAPRSVLLIQRRHDPFAGRWALPGGFVDAGERVARAAARELAEETAIEGRVAARAPRGL
jgi:8-oxo-dGTP diphosphatase